MDPYLAAFSTPRGGVATRDPPRDTSPAVGSALPPDARVVGSRAGIAVPTNKARAPGAQRATMLEQESDSGAVSLSSSPSARRTGGITETVQEACAHAMAKHQCLIHVMPSGEGDVGVAPGSSHHPQASATPLSHSPSTTPTAPRSDSPDAPAQTGAVPTLLRNVPRLTVSLCGTQAQVNEAKSELLSTLPTAWQLQMHVPWADVMDSSNDAHARLKPNVRARFDDIMQQSGTTLVASPLEAQEIETCAGMAKRRNILLTITGGVEAIEYARVQVLVFLDELNEIYIDSIEIDRKLLHVGAGRKRAAIQAIERESGAWIYLPMPFAGVLQSKVPPTVSQRRNTVFIAGASGAVERAKDALNALASKGRNLVMRQVSLMPRKIDWLLQERLEALRELMLDNSTYLEFPPMGSQQSQVSVYGASRVDVERSIRILMQLVSPYYVATLWLLPGLYDSVGLSKADSRNIASLLSSASAASGAEMSFQGQCFEMCGTDTEVRAALRHLMRQTVLKHYMGDVRFQLELATDHREFISGKKNGKINKIMEGCGVRIRFEPFNDYNFLIDVLGREPEAALQGLSQLQEELPAEMSFHVPEAYHKRIIGVGGKNIQRIMKKFGVYVKFSNAEEFAALGGYIDNDDNVIARTPSKNAPNLENLKNSVMELVSPKDKDFVTETLSVPRKFHRVLLSENVIAEVEHRTRCSIRFARKESGQDTVLIFGPESQVAVAAQLLLQHVPLDVEMTVSHSFELGAMLESPDYVALVERMQKELGITLEAKPRHKNTTGECVFQLSLSQSNANLLPVAKDMLEELCTKHNVLLHAPVTPASEPYNAPMPPFSMSRFSPSKTDSGESVADKPPPPSTKDLKALFDQPSGTVPEVFEQGTNTPFMSPFYTPGYSDAGGLSAQVWGAPLPSLQDMGSLPSKPSMFSPFSSGPIPFPFQPTDLALGNTESGRAPGTTPFHPSNMLPRSDVMTSLPGSMDVGAFAPHPIARSPLNMRSSAEMGNDMDSFHPISDPTPRSNLSMMGPPGSAPAPRSSTLSMPRSSISAGAPSDTMDEVTRVLAQIAFDKQ
ncbi:Similar to S.cerevisiae protein YLL032C (Protein of unknown function) [Malassezia sympodialis ATCC 42132]|uniref:K Homology domain-containing protein n=1 Tax=Malassezia sympodialis (strain ATCC 42132) TaxID=1230383 RepID=A0A1M8A4I7_MALS4|nr:Similar to S.cerevisiae protein YLL032C (Protein of unknown function) [Malassezia sympodialis ATCC 42132]